LSKNNANPTRDNLREATIKPCQLTRLPLRGEELTGKTPSRQHPTSSPWGAFMALR